MAIKRQIYLINRGSIWGGFESISVRIRLFDLLSAYVKTHDKNLVVVHENELLKTAIKKNSIIFFSRTIGIEALNFLYEKRASLNLIIIYDLDDLLCHWPDYSLHPGYGNIGVEKFIRFSDLTLVPNQRFKNELDALYDSSTVVVFPTYIDSRKYSLWRRPSKSLISSKSILFTNSDHLKMESKKSEFEGALEEICSKNNLHVVNIGDYFLNINSKYQIFFPKMDFDDYLKFLMINTFLFSVVPLGGSEDGKSYRFNSVKSDIKYKHYAVAEIPGIYSAVPPYIDGIANKHNGFLVQNTYESWLKGMGEFVANPSLRQEIVKNAFHDVIGNHSIDVGVGKLGDLLKGLSK